MMKAGLTPYLIVVASATFLCSLSACSGSQRNGAGRSAARPTEVAQPLTSRTAHAELLRGVNSIEISTPSIPNGAGPVGIAPAEALRMVEQAARETMTLKVSRADGKAKGSQRAVTKTPTHGDVDAVLLTELLRFEERQGSAVGGEPAVVSFRMSMQAVPSGEEVWSAQYFYRQEALSENLLRINERVGSAGYGAGWRSAQELFQRGLTTALQDFNNQRERQFLSVAR